MTESEHGENTAFEGEETEFGGADAVDTTEVVVETETETKAAAETPTGKTDDTPAEGPAEEKSEESHAEGTEESHEEKTEEKDVEAAVELEHKFGLCNFGDLWCTWCCRGIWCFPATWCKIGNAVGMSGCLTIILPFITCILLLLGTGVSLAIAFLDEDVYPEDWELPDNLEEIGEWSAIAGGAAFVVVFILIIVSMVCIRKSYNQKYYGDRMRFGLCCKAALCHPCSAGEMGATLEANELMPNGLCCCR